MAGAVLIAVNYSDETISFETPFEIIPQPDDGGTVHLMQRRPKEDLLISRAEQIKGVREATLLDLNTLVITLGSDITEIDRNHIPQKIADLIGEASGVKVKII